MKNIRKIILILTVFSEKTKPVKKGTKKQTVFQRLASRNKSKRKSDSEGEEEEEQSFCRMKTTPTTSKSKD